MIGMVMLVGIGFIMGRCLPRPMTVQSLKDYFMLRGEKGNK